MRCATRMLLTRGWRLAGGSSDGEHCAVEHAVPCDHAAASRRCPHQAGCTGQATPATGPGVQVLFVLPDVCVHASPGSDGVAAALRLPPGGTAAQRSRFPPAHTRSCSHALVSHSSAMHVRQEREDNASIIAAASRRKLRRRWRGLGRAIGRLLTLHKQVMEQTYAPGGAGYERARAEFRLCV